MVSIPSVEPKQVISGDTWQWTKAFSDYPSSTWALNYFLRVQGQKEEITFAAAADGSDGFAVTVAVAVTKAILPGRHSWLARVSSGAVVTTVGQGSIEVLPDFAQLNVDHRTWYERALDAVEAVMENRADTDQASFSVEDRSVSRMGLDELMGLRRWLKDKVAQQSGIKTNRVRLRL